MRLLDGDHRVRQALLSGELAARATAEREEDHPSGVPVSLEVAR
jgi:hypothetical protein